MKGVLAFALATAACATSASATNTVIFDLGFQAPFLDATATAQGTCASVNDCYGNWVFGTIHDGYAGDVGYNDIIGLTLDYGTTDTLAPFVDLSFATDENGDWVPHHGYHLVYEFQPVFGNMGYSLYRDGSQDRIVVGLTLTPRVPPVPEPATWAMMVSGFGLVGGLMRRRRAIVSFC